MMENGVVITTNEYKDLIVKEAKYDRLKDAIGEVVFNNFIEYKGKNMVENTFNFSDDIMDVVKNLLPEVYTIALNRAKYQAKHANDDWADLND